MSDRPADGDIEYLQRIAVSHLATRILVSGVQIGVFESIGNEEKTAIEIAEETESSVRGIRMLLDCLVSLQLLKKSAGKYRLAPVSLRCLRKNSPEYMGYLWESDSVLEQWNRLNEAIRTGKPLRERTLEEKAASFASLVRSLHVVQWQPAEKAAEILGAGNSAVGMNVIDVACGSGVWGIAIAKADRTAQIVAQDLPEVLEIAKAYTKDHQVDDQFTFLPGDLRAVDLGEERFDLAILGNIVHSEGERSSRQLLARVYRALKGPGRIAIIDILPDEERTGPQSSLMVALAMLLDTEEGDLFTLPEYKAWLNEAGFTNIETADIGTHSPMILALKP